jgi:uncharacterized protein YsxB (DUF464 family)
MISIHVYERSGKIARIQVRGHARGKMGERACHGISALCRVLLIVIDDKLIHSEFLRWGEFDFAVKKDARSQRAAQHTITGFEMFAKAVPKQVMLVTL